MPEFDPQPNDLIEVSSFHFKVAEHPGAPGQALAETGARATVFQLLQSDGSRVAMKVFKRRYRDPYQLEVARRIEPFAHLQGFKAAQRLVITDDVPIAQRYTDLKYAVIMPWVRGLTWFAVMRAVSDGERVLQPDHAFHVARSFLGVMCAAEDRSIAHTDVASGNVLMDLDHGKVELIDLEELFAPGFKQPEKLNTGTVGYRHQGPTSQSGLWCVEADRYATAVLLGEILALASPDARSWISGETLFASSEEQRPGPRYDWLLRHLSGIDPRLGDAFQQAWESKTLGECPTARTLADVFDRYVMPRTRAPVGAAMVVPSARSGWWLPSGIVSPKTPPPPPNPPPRAAEALVGWKTLVDTPWVPPQSSERTSSPESETLVDAVRAPGPDSRNPPSAADAAARSSYQPPSAGGAVVGFQSINATITGAAAPQKSIPSFLRAAVIPPAPGGVPPTMPPEPSMTSTLPVATTAARSQGYLLELNELKLTHDKVYFSGGEVPLIEVRSVMYERRPPGRAMEWVISLIGLGFMAAGASLHTADPSYYFMASVCLVAVMLSVFWVRPSLHAVVAVDADNRVHLLGQFENESPAAMALREIEAARRALYR